MIDALIEKNDGTLANEPDRDQKLTAYCYGVQGLQTINLNFEGKHGGYKNTQIMREVKIFPSEYDTLIHLIDTPQYVVQLKYKIYKIMKKKSRIQSNRVGATMGELQNRAQCK